MPVRIPGEGSLALPEAVGPRSGLGLIWVEASLFDFNIHIHLPFIGKF